MADFEEKAALAFGGVACALAGGVYAFVRPYIDKTVNCHFCNTDSKVWRIIFGLKKTP